jgi:hypothetical protein
MKKKFLPSCQVSCFSNCFKCNASSESTSLGDELPPKNEIMTQFPSGEKGVKEKELVSLLTTEWRFHYAYFHLERVWYKRAPSSYWRLQSIHETLVDIGAYIRDKFHFIASYRMLENIERTLRVPFHWSEYWNENELAWVLEEYIPFKNGLLERSTFQFIKISGEYFIKESSVIPVSYNPTAFREGFPDDFKTFLLGLCGNDVDSVNILRGFLKRCFHPWSIFQTSLFL